MKKLFLLLAVSIGLVILIINCSSDIILPEPVDITGQYEGWYVYRNPQFLDTQAVTFDFDCQDVLSPKYRLKMDTTSADLHPGFCICVGFGNYAITDKLELREVNFRAHGEQESVGIKCTTCDANTVPKGVFSINRVADTLKLTRQTADSLWQLILLRTGDCTSN
jgi:hypothetical protein